MSGSINQMFVKIFALNLIVVGLFAVAVPLIAIYQRKYDNQEQVNRLYLYLGGGILLIIIGALIY